MKLNEYSQLLETYAFLKKIQQISWESNQLLKQFPIESVTEQTLPDMLKAYSALRERTINAIKDEVYDK